jgi:hypothetical protein
MSQLNLNADKSRLTGITRDISIQWEQTKAYWRDQRSAEFEKKYMDELFNYTGRTVMVIEKLDELMKKVRSDCE